MNKDAWVLLAGVVVWYGAGFLGFYVLWDAPNEWWSLPYGFTMFSIGLVAALAAGAALAGIMGWDKES